MKIFDRLKGVKSAASFAELIPQLEADLATAEAEVRALEGKREDAIFAEGEAGIAKLQAAIAAAKDRVETLKIAIDGARRRQADAAAAEHNAKLEARHREALKLSADERRLLKQWHVAAKKLAEITGELKAVQKSITAENNAMRAEGRPDLLLPNHAREIDTKRQAAWDAAYRGMAHPPVNHMPEILLHVPELLKIDHYWPAPDIAADREWLGPPLAFLE